MKKIITLLLLFVSLANADYILYVNSPEEVDSMYAILNAIAKIFGSEDYLSLLKLMFLFGGFVALYSWVLGTFRDGGKEGGFSFTKFHIGAVALLTLVFSVQTTVWVKSEHFPKYYDSNDSATYTMGVAVDNIPEVAAYSMYFLNRFGRSLTNMYEVAMSPVGSYSLKDGGYASTLRDDFQLLSMKIGDTDHTLGEAIDTIVSQCVYIPFSAKGEEGQQRINELLSSSNIKNTIDNWYSSGVTVGGIKASEYIATYTGEEWKCGDLWDYIKSSLLEDYKEKAGKYLNRLDSRDLEMLTGLKNVPKSDFDEIAIQAGIVNSVLDNKDIGVGVSYAQGKTQAEFVQQNLGAGYYMAKMLPVMQSLFRSLIYALLPAILAIALLPGGWQIIKNYAKTAVWIELWGVIAAILNFFILKYTEHNVAGDISVYNSGKMLGETAAMAGMAGYLYLMVPGIAWGLMSGSFNMLEGLGRGVASNLNKNMSSGSYAEDHKKMELKRAASEQMGKNLSYAETLHYQNQIKGFEEGTAIGVKEKQGEAAIKELADYSVHKPFQEFEEKKNSLKKLGYTPSASNVAGVEAKVSAGSLSKSLGDLDETGGTKKMYDRGRMGAASDIGKLDTVGVKGSYNIAAGSAAKSLGEVQVAGIDGMKGAGRKQGREDKAAAALEKKHGAKISQASFNKQNEDIVKTNERIDTLNKEVGNVDSYFETSAKQDVKTQEVPNFYRNDRNGDGTVSDNEINFEKNINTVDAKKAVVDKYTAQEQLAKNAEKNKSSNSSTVRAAQSKGEALVEGLDKRSKAIIGASATKTEVSSKVENANQRKDSRVIEQLNSNGKDMEDTAVLDTKRMVGDLSQMKTQTDTTGGLIKDLVHKKNEIKEKIQDSLQGRQDLSWGQKVDTADKMLMHSLAKVGIADANLTQKNLSRDVSQIENETQSKLRAGLEKTVGKSNLKTLDAYNTLLQNRENLAHRAETASTDHERQEAKNALKQYDEVILPNFEKSKDMQAVKDKIEAYHNSNEAQSIIKKGQAKLESTYKSYENMGLIKRDNDGQIKVADTAKTINTLKGEQKALYVEQVKRSLDGLKTSTVGIDGMQLERVDNVLGEHMTERATATQEWSKTGKFNNDIQYHAVQNQWIKADNMATLNTSVHTVKSMLSMYGFAKIIK
jgi:conjugal transfer mating pair stabilization protein TraG